MTQATTQQIGDDPQPGLSVGVVAAALVLLAVFVFYFKEFFFPQVRWAIQEQADWGHTIVVPFIAGYFVYLNREKILSRPFRTAWIGVLPILIGMAIYTVSVFGHPRFSHHNIRGLGVITTLGGICLLFCGFRVMTYLLFPLAYVFVFGQTISERFMSIVTFQMQDITARGAHIVLTLIGCDTERQGNTIYIFDDGVRKPLNIAEACSGMRMLMAFMALGVAMAYTGLRRIWQRVLVVLMGVPTAIFVNILRVVTLGLLSLIDAEFAAGDFHSFIGLVWLLPAFLIYLGVIWIVRHLVVDEQAAT